MPRSISRIHSVTSEKHRDLAVAGRAVEVGHAPLDEVLEVPVVVGVDDLLETLHFRRGLGVVELAAEVLVARHHRLGVGDAFHDRLEHGLGVVELRLLREVADLGALRHLHRAHEVGVESGEDLEEGRLAGAVGADDADVRAVEEREVDVLEDGLGPLLLGDVHEAELVFSCHFAFSLTVACFRSPRRRARTPRQAPSSPRPRAPRRGRWTRGARGRRRRAACAGARSRA